MPKISQQEKERCEQLLEEFSEIPAIGSDMAASITKWMAENLDEECEFASITPDMSGDTVVSIFTEQGIAEKDVVTLIKCIGFTGNEEFSDDTVDFDVDVKKTSTVSERMNEFLGNVVEVTKKYPFEIDEIEAKGREKQGKEEVRIFIKADMDLRKCPATDARRRNLMDMLKELRVFTHKFYMTDEAFFYVRAEGLFVISFKSYS